MPALGSACLPSGTYLHSTAGCLVPNVQRELVLRGWMPMPADANANGGRVPVAGSAAEWTCGGSVLPEPLRRILARAALATVAVSEFISAARQRGRLC